MFWQNKATQAVPSARHVALDNRPKSPAPRRAFDPAAFGFKRADISELVGGDAEANAASVRSVLGGAKGAVLPAKALVGA